jgi:hypothetical protein
MYKISSPCVLVVYSFPSGGSWSISGVKGGALEEVIKVYSRWGHEGHVQMKVTRLYLWIIFPTRRSLWITCHGRSLLNLSHLRLLCDVLSRWWNDTPQKTNCTTGTDNPAACASQKCPELFLSCYHLPKYIPTTQHDENISAAKT